MKILKKILLCFSVFTLFFFSLSLTSCTFNNGIKQVLKSEINNFVNSSSVVVRPGILNEHDNVDPNFSWKQMFNQTGNFLLGNGNKKLFSFQANYDLGLKNFEDKPDSTIFDTSNANGNDFYHKFINLDTKLNKNDKQPLQFSKILKILNLANVALKFIIPFNGLVVQLLNGISNKISHALNTFLVDKRFTNLLTKTNIKDNYYHFQDIFDAFYAATLPLNTNLNYNDAITIAFYNISKAIANLSNDTQELTKLRNVYAYNSKKNNLKEYFSYQKINEKIIAKIQTEITEYEYPGVSNSSQNEIFPDFKKVLKLKKYTYSNWVSVILLIQSFLILINYFSQYKFINFDVTKKDANYSKLFSSDKNNNNNDVKTKILDKNYVNKININHILNNISNIITHKDDGLFLVQLANIFFNPLSYDKNKNSIYEDFGPIFINQFFLTAIPNILGLGHKLRKPLFTLITKIMAAIAENGNFKTIIDAINDAINSLLADPLIAFVIKSLLKKYKDIINGAKKFIIPNFSKTHWVTGLFINNVQNTLILSEIIKILHSFKKHFLDFIKIPVDWKKKQDYISFKIILDKLLFDKNNYFFSNREYLDLFKQSIQKYLAKNPTTLVDIKYLNNLFLPLTKFSPWINIKNPSNKYNNFGYIISLLASKNNNDHNKAYQILGYQNNKDFKPDSFFDNIKKFLGSKNDENWIIKIFQNYSNRLINKYNSGKWNQFMQHKNWTIKDIRYNSIKKKINNKNINFILPNNIEYNLIYTDLITKKVYTYHIKLQKHNSEFVYYHICNVEEITK